MEDQNGPSPAEIQTPAEQLLATPAQTAPKPLPLWVKILVPVLILLAVLGVWAYKNSQTNSLAGIAAENWPPLFTEEQFALEDLAAYNVPVLLVFGSETCGPCQVMKPFLQDVYEETVGRAVVQYVNIDDNYWVMYEYPVAVTPTTVLYTAGGVPYQPAEGKEGSLIQYEFTETGEPAFTVQQGLLLYDQIMELLEDMGMEPA